VLPEEIVVTVTADGCTSNNDTGDPERDFVVDRGDGAIDLALEVVSNPEMALKFARALRAVGVVATVATLFSACQEPTQITLEIRTNIACEFNLSTAIVIGNSDAEAESAAPGTVTEMCHPDGRIGAIVLLPRSSKDEPISIRVVMGVGSGFDAEKCLLDPNQKTGEKSGCIVARRSLRFIPSTPLYLPVMMRDGCIGVPCLPGQTCSLGNTCESSVVVNPGECDEPGKCPQDVPGGGGAGGATGSSSSSSSSNSSSSGQSGASASSSSSSASSSNSGGAGGTGGFGGTGGTGGVAGTGGMAVSSSSSSGIGGAGGIGGMMAVSSSSSSGIAGAGGIGGMGGMAVSSSSSSGIGGFGGAGGMAVSSSSSSSSGIGGFGGAGGMAVSSSSSSSNGAGGMGGSSTSSNSSSTGGLGGKIIFDDAGVSLDAGAPNPLAEDYQDPERLIPPGILIPGQQYVAPIRRSTSSKQRKAPAKAIPALRLPLYTYPRNVKP
jgi:hypothetical protein